MISTLIINDYSHKRSDKCQSICPSLHLLRLSALCCDSMLFCPITQKQIGLTMEGDKKNEKDRKYDGKL